MPQKPFDEKYAKLLNSLKETKTVENAEKGDEVMKKKITQEMRNGLNELGFDDATINGLSYDAAEDILKNKKEISDTLDHITDTQKITSEMREGLNSLGMDDATINGLTYNEAAGILRDKDEIAASLGKSEELNVTEGAPKEKGTPVNEDNDWIDQKVRDYEQMKTEGNQAIKTIIPDKKAGTFSAEVDNGMVVYTSKNDVAISRDSSFKVFDTVMKEPSNAGKAIRVPEEATPEFKTNLFAAAVLNGHKVNGAEGLELDMATLQKIGLTQEQIDKVVAAVPHKEEKPAEKTAKVEKEAEDKPLPGPYNPKNDRISHLMERKNMVEAIKNAGKPKGAKPVNPTKPTYIFKNTKEGESR